MKCQEKNGATPLTGDGKRMSPGAEDGYSTRISTESVGDGGLPAVELLWADRDVVSMLTYFRFRKAERPANHPGGFRLGMRGRHENKTCEGHSN